MSDDLKDNPVADEVEVVEDEITSGGPALGSLELGQMTFVVPGQEPMTMEQLKVHQAEEESRLQEQADFHANEDAIRKAGPPIANINQMLQQMDAEESLARGASTPRDPHDPSCSPWSDGDFEELTCVDESDVENALTHATPQVRDMNTSRTDAENEA